MQYFTKEWCFSRLDDNEISNHLNAYRSYIDRVYSSLPFTLKLLVKHISLHDGLIRKISFTSQSESLALNMICGDLQVGYFLIEIVYHHVSNVTEELLTKIFKNARIEILSDEVEVLSHDIFSHKILFSNEKHIDIHFRDIQLSIKNVHSEEYKKEFCILEIH